MKGKRRKEKVWAKKSRYLGGVEAARKRKRGGNGMATAGTRYPRTGSETEHGYRFERGNRAAWRRKGSGFLAVKNTPAALKRSDASGCEYPRFGAKMAQKSVRRRRSPGSATCRGKSPCRHGRRRSQGAGPQLARGAGISPLGLFSVTVSV